MSTYFSCVIKAGERNREFNVRQVVINAARAYKVDVPDERGNRITFTMLQNQEGKWQMTDQALPAWLYDAENNLHKAIEENRKQNADR